MNNIRFTAAVLVLGRHLIFSQKENEVIEFFGGSDKGFPYDDPFIFSLELGKLMEKYSFPEEKIKSYKEEVLTLEIPDRQMVYLCLLKAGILVKDMEMICHQRPSGLDQFFYQILEAEYGMPIGFTLPLKKVEELESIKKRGHICMEKIKDPHFAIDFYNLQFVDTYMIQRTHREPLDLVLKKNNISKY